MRFFQTLPTDKDFFQTYAKFSKGIQSSTYAAQLVSGITETVIIYAAFQATFQPYFAPKVVLILALFGAIIGTLLIEIGLRYFLPNAVDAFLYRRFSGLYLAMSIFIIGMSLALIGASGYLSFSGSKKIVRHFTPLPEQQTTTKADSLHHAAKLEVWDVYAMDSSSTTNQYNQLIAAAKQSHNSSLAALETKLSNYQGKEIRTGNSYATAKDRIRAKIKEMEANRDAKVDVLTQSKTNTLQALNKRKTRQIDSLNNLLLATTDKIETDNKTARDKVESTIQANGSSFGWFTVVCLLYLIVCIAIDRITKKGSGIMEVVVPTDYYFRPSILTEATTAIGERLNQLARQRITDFQNETAPPPLPVAPHSLLDISNFEQPQYLYKFPSIPTPAPELTTMDPPFSISSNKDVQDLEILEEQITNYLEATVMLESENLHQQAEEMRLKATDVIKSYLERDGKKANDDEISIFESKVIAFVNGTSTVNPFTKVRQQIGFKTGAQEQKSPQEGSQFGSTSNLPNDNRIDENRIKEIDKAKNRICHHCGQGYIYKHHKQKYCSDDCRIKFWENKTGKKFGKKKTN